MKELVVGLPLADLIKTDAGAVYMLELDGSGDITSTTGNIVQGFTIVPVNTQLGASVGVLGDWNNDGVDDLVIGAPTVNVGGDGEKGGVAILAMKADHTIKRFYEISVRTSTILGAYIRPGDMFGSSVHAIGDLDGNGVIDLAIGSSGVNGGGSVYVLLMKSDGSFRIPGSTRLNAYADRPAIADVTSGDAFGSSEFVCVMDVLWFVDSLSAQALASLVISMEMVLWRSFLEHLSMMIKAQCTVCLWTPPAY